MREEVCQKSNKEKNFSDTTCILIGNEKWACFVVLSSQKPKCQLCFNTYQNLVFTCMHGDSLESWKWKSVNTQCSLGWLNFFSGSKLVYAWCNETILITNCYTFGSNEGITCVLCTLKINHKHFVSMETAPPIVNKAVINALQLQLFSKMRKVNPR